MWLGRRGRSDDLLGQRTLMGGGLNPWQLRERARDEGEGDRRDSCPPPPSFLLAHSAIEIVESGGGAAKNVFLNCAEEERGQRLVTTSFDGMAVVDLEGPASQSPLEDIVCPRDPQRQCRENQEARNRTDHRREHSMILCWREKTSL